MEYRNFQLVCRRSQNGDFTIRLVTPDMAEHLVFGRKWFYLETYLKYHPNSFKNLTIQYNPKFYEKSSSYSNKQCSVTFEDPVYYPYVEEYLDH